MLSSRIRLGLLLTLCLSAVLLMGGCRPGGHAAQSGGARMRTAQASVAASPQVTGAATSPAGLLGGRNACSLVTRQEAIAAMGIPLGAGRATTAAHALQCIYGDVEHSLIIVAGDEGRAGYDKAHQAVIKGPGGWSEVHGIGAGAFELHQQNLMASVTFYQAPAIVSIVLVGSTTPSATQAALRVAKLAASRV